MEPGGPLRADGHPLELPRLRDSRAPAQSPRDCGAVCGGDLADLAPRNHDRRYRAAPGQDPVRALEDLDPRYRDRQLQSGPRSGNLCADVVLRSRARLGSGGDRLRPTASGWSRLARHPRTGQAPGPASTLPHWTEAARTLVTARRACEFLPLRTVGWDVASDARRVPVHRRGQRLVGAVPQRSRPDGPLFEVLHRGGLAVSPPAPFRAGAKADGPGSVRRLRPLPHLWA